MAQWDVFHSERLEVQRGLSSAEVREALARGDLREDDLIRPAGTMVPWGPIADLPALFEPEPPETEAFVDPGPGEKTAAEPPETLGIRPGDAKVADVLASEFPSIGASLEIEPVSILPHEALLAQPATTEDLSVEGFGQPPVDELHLQGLLDDDDDEPSIVPDRARDEIPEARLEAVINDEDDSAENLSHDAIIDDDGDNDDSGERAVSRFQLEPEALSYSGSKVALPAAEDGEEEWQEEEDDHDPLEEDEAAAEFTLARSGAETVEELDLAAMVDVAFQLVLFFLVTATTILYKTLDVPKPNSDAPPGAVTQGQGKSLDDLSRDFILVEIDPQGSVKVDHEAAPSDMPGLAERLRQARSSSGRIKMLLSADAATMHRSAVTAYDAANEIGLGIAIAKPTNSGASAPPAAK